MGTRRRIFRRRHAEEARGHPDALFIAERAREAVVRWTGQTNVRIEHVMISGESAVAVVLMRDGARAEVSLRRDLGEWVVALAREDVS